ncbi:MAG: hypothetical protein PVI06_15475 [Desulfobacterales bacterium]|jgi:hypothetical protein
MKDESIEMLADAIKEYYSNYELDDLCNQFDIEINYQDADPDYMELARSLTTTTGHQRTQRFFKTLIPNLLKRCNERIANSTSEDLIYHQQMIHHIEGFKLLLREPREPVQIRTPGSHIFSDKFEIQTYFSSAKSDVIIVDPWIGVGTLDCVVGVKSQIRLLTGKGPNSYDPGFEATLKRFRKKIPNIAIRLYTPLQDRFVVFNDRCWLAGASLKDAGAATLNLIEIRDHKQLILREIARKWSEAEDFFSSAGGKAATQKPTDAALDLKSENTGDAEKKKSSIFGFLKK